MAEGRLKRTDTKKKKMKTAQALGSHAFGRLLPLAENPSKKMSMIKLNKGLLNALIKKNIEDVKQCLEQGANVNCRLKERWPMAQLKRNPGYGLQNDIIIFSEGTTPLIIASALQMEDAVRLLIEKGADVNARNRGGITALMEAASYSTPEICELLIQNGADVNARGGAGGTPLIFAAMYNNLDNCELLLSLNADLEIKNNAGDTALSEAANVHDKGIVDFLLSKGANPWAKNNEGKTPKEMVDLDGWRRMSGLDLRELSYYSSIALSIERYEKLWMAASGSLEQAEKAIPEIIRAVRNCNPEDTERHFKGL